MKSLTQKSTLSSTINMNKVNVNNQNKIHSPKPKPLRNINIILKNNEKRYNDVKNKKLPQDIQKGYEDVMQKTQNILALIIEKNKWIFSSYKKTKSAFPCFVSTCQNVLLTNGKYKKVEDLNINDRIIDAFGYPRSITYINHIGHYTVRDIFHDTQLDTENTKRKEEKEIECLEDSIDICVLRTKRSRLNVIVPQFNYIYTEYYIHDYDDNQTQSKWTRMYDLLNDDNNENKYNKYVSMVMPNYELPSFLKTEGGDVCGYAYGFVLGAFLTCGSTFYTKDFQAGKNIEDFIHVQFYCESGACSQNPTTSANDGARGQNMAASGFFKDRSQNPTTSANAGTHGPPYREILKRCLYKSFDGGHIEMNDFDVFEESIPHSNIQKIIVRSPALARLMMILGKKRDFPEEWYCTSYEYVRGLYDAIMYSNYYYVTEKTYNLLLFLESILYKYDNRNDIAKRSEILSIENLSTYMKKEDKDKKKKKEMLGMSMIMTNTPDECTTLICDTIPMSSYVL